MTDDIRAKSGPLRLDRFARMRQELVYAACRVADFSTLPVNVRRMLAQLPVTTEQIQAEYVAAKGGAQ